MAKLFYLEDDSCKNGASVRNPRQYAEDLTLRIQTLMGDLLLKTTATCKVK